MSKRAAAVMRSHASNLRFRAKRLKASRLMSLSKGFRDDVDIAIEDIENIADALEHAADEELEAGKRWWKDQEAQRTSQMKAEMAEVQRKVVPPRQEPWL